MAAVRLPLTSIFRIPSWPEGLATGWFLRPVVPGWRPPCRVSAWFQQVLGFSLPRNGH